MTKVVVIGASRSGTGLMVRLLAANGCHAGDDLTMNHESWFFQRLNRWLLFNAGGGLETPEAIDVLLADPLVRPVATAIVKARVWRHPWAYHACACFKDPRTTFTLPIWLDVLADDDVKVIHMLRHGRDVAASLVARRARVDARWAHVSPEQRAQSLSLIDEQRVVANLRMSTIPAALAHWRLYVTRALVHAEALGREQLLTVRYEDLLTDPDATLARLSAFVGLGITPRGVPLDASRAFAHRDTPTVRVDQADSPDALLRALGYDY